MEIKLHNTLSRKKSPFQPIDPNNVRIYVCGPTVYDRIHIGNARPFVVFDCLFRLLCHAYGGDRVAYARNITDIDDKIMQRAAERNLPIAELTETTIRSFRADVEALGCLEPSIEPKATDHVDDMIALIETLITRGHAYPAQGHVLFDVKTDPGYGKLSGRSRDEQVAGARVEVAPYKRDPADFVLWKPSSGDEPGWPSPWGHGRPGWHIECSAMSERFLGLPFDIHGGGIDLVFPHHENEIAQSCCAHGQDTMAQVWMHNGFVDMAGEKMSKSTGNLLTVDEALAIAPGEAVRLWLISAHYRQPLDFSKTGLERAKKTLDRFYRILDRNQDDQAGEIDPKMSDALADDLNTPRAMAALHEMALDVNKGKRPASDFRASANLLGLLQADPAQWLKGSQDDVAVIEALIDERVDARANKDFARADAIRGELDAMGVVIEDGPAGSTWRRRS